MGRFKEKLRSGTDSGNWIPLGQIQNRGFVPSKEMQDDPYGNAYLSYEYKNNSVWYDLEPEECIYDNSGNYIYSIAQYRVGSIENAREQQDPSLFSSYLIIRKLNINEEIILEKIYKWTGYGLGNPTLGDRWRAFGLRIDDENNLVFNISTSAYIQNNNSLSLIDIGIGIIKFDTSLNIVFYKLSKPNFIGSYIYKSYSAMSPNNILYQQYSYFYPWWQQGDPSINYLIKMDGNTGVVDTTLHTFTFNSAEVGFDTQRLKCIDSVGNMYWTTPRIPASHPTLLKISPSGSLMWSKQYSASYDVPNYTNGNYTMYRFNWLNQDLLVDDNDNLIGVHLSSAEGLNIDYSDGLIILAKANSNGQIINKKSIVFPYDPDYLSVWYTRYISSAEIIRDNSNNYYLILESNSNMSPVPNTPEAMRKELLKFSTSSFDIQKYLCMSIINPEINADLNSFSQYSGNNMVTILNNNLCYIPYFAVYPEPIGADNSVTSLSYVFSTVININNFNSLDGSYYAEFYETLYEYWPEYTQEAVFPVKITSESPELFDISQYTVLSDINVPINTYTHTQGTTGLTDYTNLTYFELQDPAPDFGFTRKVWPL